MSRLHNVGYLLILFVFLACLLSLVAPGTIPLSILINRCLLAVLAAGCLLARL